MANFPKSKSRPWIPKREREPFFKRSSDNAIKFYNSKRWRSLRQYFFSMNPLCNTCKQAGYTTPGTDVDHITPIRLGGQPYSIKNLQTLCKSCHARKSGKEVYEKKYKKLITESRG